MPLSSTLSQIHSLCVVQLLPIPWIIRDYVPTKAYRFLPVFVPSIIHKLVQGPIIVPPMAFTSFHDWDSNLLPPEGRASTLTTESLRLAIGLYYGYAHFLFSYLPAARFVLPVHSPQARSHVQPDQRRQRRDRQDPPNEHGRLPRGIHLRCARL